MAHENLKLTIDFSELPNLGCTITDDNGVVFPSDLTMGERNEILRALEGLVTAFYGGVIFNG